jgi:ankyrin repeat protein
VRGALHRADAPPCCSRDRAQALRTPLHCAALHGQAEIAKFFIASGAEVDARTRAGETALSLAAAGCHIEVATVLLEAGANPFERVTTPPLVSAAARGDCDMATLLLEKGVSASEAYKDGRTALHEASTGAVATLLLSRGADARRADAQGRTPLHGPADGGLPPPDVVAALLAGGADARAVDKDGNTPLHCATGATRAALPALLAAGANANAANKRGRTPLHAALEIEKFEYLRGGDAEAYIILASALLAAGASAEAPDATGMRPMHTVRQASALGASPALVTKRSGGGEPGWTPLHAAARIGDVAAVKAELAARDGGPASLADAALHVQRVMHQDVPDACARAQGGETPLHCAAGAGHADAVAVLVEASGPDRLKEHIDIGGATPLHAAAAGGHAACVALLLEAGFDVNALDNAKFTPLLRAAAGGHFALARALLDAGAVVNVNYGHGSTLLFVTAGQASAEAAELARLLMDKGANHLTATYTGAPSHGGSPLGAAARAGALDMARLLIERGADTKETDWAGAMPLDGVSCPEMRRLLRSYDVEVQRVLEARVRAAADSRAAEEAEAVRRQLEQTAAVLEAAARTEAEQKAAAAAAAAAAATAEAQRRKADEDKRRAKLEEDAKRRAQKEAEELARAAAEEEHWRLQSRMAQQAEEKARAAEEHEAAVTAALTCATCADRLRADGAGRGGKGAPLPVRLLGAALRAALWASIGAAAAVYHPGVAAAVRRVGDKLTPKATPKAAPAPAPAAVPATGAK